MTASPQAAAGSAAPADTAPADAGEPRWLSSTEKEAWQAVAALMLQLPGPLDAQLQQDSGLTLFEYLVLSSLSMAPDRTSRMSGLARLANGSQSRLSNVARRLEERGWLRREPDPRDGRSTVARLTDRGWDVVQAAAPGHVEAVRRMVIDPLSGPQLEALSAAAHSIVRGLEEAGQACREQAPDCGEPGSGCDEGSPC
ncbi:MAG TPA: MarR family transcriptional regulator [Streptosporangiaceae bacterium]|nr:MarR family transcriptional regulator [Streptosporangiaceae bacterium]